MTNQRRSRFLDVLSADALSVGAARVMETAFWSPRPGASLTRSTEVIDLASRRSVCPPRLS